LYRELEQLKLFENTDFVHAHNLFNDGAVAYRLKKKYNIDYVVTIRLTDTELQYKYMYQRRPFIHKVLKNAKRIIFISEQSKDSLVKRLPKKVTRNIEKKFALVPNGIDDFWINNIASKKELDQTNPFKLLFVGRIIPLKNIELILEACRIVNKKGDFKVVLSIVGGESPDHQDYYKTFLKQLQNYDFVEYLNKISDKNELRDIYRRADAFILPSKAELFGLVYLEALSQGLPVIYSKNSGISSYLSNSNVGVKLKVADAFALSEAINEVYRNYDTYEIPQEFIQSFDWGNISEDLYRLYFAKAL
jgi:glycosyltransferase involved in cell wall biosynthesis